MPEPVLGRIEQALRQRETRRDELYDRARHLRRSAQSLMGRIHEGSSTEDELANLRQSTTAFARELHAAHREESHVGADALQECAEALLLASVVRAEPLPGPDELGIPPEPYLLGLGDLVGEVRRLALRALADGELDRADRYLQLMDVLYHALMRFDAPRAIVALKPKQDVARALLERTRGEVTMARVLARAQLPARGVGGDGGP